MKRRLWATRDYLICGREEAVGKPYGAQYRLGLIFRVMCRMREDMKV